MTSAEQLAAWRADTPGTSHRNHLNNAGAALMPRPVLRAMTEHLTFEAEIGGYEAADARADQVQRGYDVLATLVGASARNIAVVANATAGFVQAVSSFDFERGDVIVTSRCDYTSNQIQYLALQHRLGVRIVHAEDLPEGGIDPDGVRRAVSAANGRCRLVAVSWIPTNSGLVQDVEGVGFVCEELGIPYLVDACQAVGQVPVDVTRLRCDYLSATARKFMRGPRGIGFMFASDRALARGDHPLFVDMRGARWANDDRYDLDPTARRYEDWEFPYALVLGQSAAAQYALTVGVDVARDRAWMLAERLRTGLRSLPRVRVLDRGARQCAIVTASFDDADARRVVNQLSEWRINTVLTLREFGRYDFADKGVDAAIRLSPHYYNTETEVDAAIEAIGRCLASHHSITESPQVSMSFADAFLPEFDNEMKTTRALLERVPFDDPTWKPHPKSTSIGALASHVAGLAGFGTAIVSQQEINIAPKEGPPPVMAQYTTSADLLSAYDANVARTRAGISALTAADLMTPWTLRNGDHVIFTMPRASVIRTMLMNHIIHHRGQLSVYLRLNDVPLPSIYGPTADT